MRIELSCCKNAGTSNSFDLAFSNLAEKLGSHNHWLGWQEAFSQNLEETSLSYVDHWHSVLVGGVESSGLLGNQSPEFVEVNRGEVESVPL